ncbi:ALF repeat-containing protein [Streptomyces sp. NPDC059957]|uniref:ALF repeat-containing protein n=1 Tax=Streptomyces sp. NPDC059957 TaxID=3347016 RepID=UPI00364C496B
MKIGPRPRGVTRPYTTAWRRLRVTAATLVSTALLVGALGSTSATAADEEELPPQTARGRVVELWMAGGPGVKAAAEAALTGTNQDIDKFLAAEPVFRRTDDRADAYSMISVGGVAVQAAAGAALQSADPQAVRTFLQKGWQAPLAQDRRVEVLAAMSAGGPGVQAEGKKALQGSPDAVRAFLESGQHHVRNTDNRVTTMALLSIGGPAMQAAAKSALKGTPAELQEFIDSGQYIARSRDQEYATVAQLAEQAKAAGAQAERSTKLAETSSQRAVKAAQEAKAAAQNAAEETRLAHADALRAAAAAATAADAARRASAAAQQAISSARAASQAARVAAAAASQASAAAIGASNAANRAHNAAFDAWGNADKASDARKLADEADAAAAAAEDSAKSLDRAVEAAQASQNAATAAKDAAGDATDAAQAATDADRHAASAGVDSRDARIAADQARRHAAEATRAATQAAALAAKARSAAVTAAKAARSAAEHARKAATEARRAADFAGQASQAAAEARKYAAEAKTAADAAETAVTQAKEAHQLVLDAEAEDLAGRTTAGIERAKDAKLATDQLQEQATQAITAYRALDEEAARLSQEAANPAAHAGVLAAKGRSVALAAAKNRGPWAKEAALEALAADDAGVRQYLLTDWKQATDDDDRAQVERIADSAEQPTPVRAAATTALGQSAPQMREFLYTGRYAAARTDNRVKVLALISAGGDSVKAAGRKALETDTPDSLNAFLKRGQHEARTTDERAWTLSLLNDPNAGSEVKAAARVALSGPPALVREFVQYGYHSAQVKDEQTAAHRHQIAGLIAEASSVAALARQNAWKAAAYSATANAEEGAARESAASAQKSADTAAGFAQDAKNSATAAQSSADKATAAASTARSAAAAAERDAAAAEDSARRAELSYAFARGSAAMANQAADDAHQAAVAAGKDAEAAEQAKWHAFGSFVEKYRQEGVQRQAEEEEKRREEKANKSKLICPMAGDRYGTACFVDDGESLTHATEPLYPFFSAAVGIDDLKECAEKKTAGSCAWAAAAIVPIPAAKLGKAAGLAAANSDNIGKLFNGVEGLALTAKAARPKILWKSDDWDGFAHVKDGHRTGGAAQKADPRKGVFEGKVVKGDEGLMKALQRTVDEGKGPSPNIDKHGNVRPGDVYELEFHKKIGKMGVDQNYRDATAIKVIVDKATGLLVSAHPI